tara:strand:- start:682 stop:861 length:180 start_codon:yes stop_codon:yes gene_type:complete
VIPIGIAGDVAVSGMRRSRVADAAKRFWQRLYFQERKDEKMDVVECVVLLDIPCGLGRW